MKKVIVITGIIACAIIIGIFYINIHEADIEIMKETTFVGVVLNGSIDDHSWSQSHYEGLEQIKNELNLSYIYRENVSAQGMVDNAIEELIAQGCEIIVANSFEFGEAVNRAAKLYPEIYFLHATGTGKERNLSTYFGRIYQIRYLSGIVAGLQTETNEIGYVAAFPISEVNRGINAFTLGVKSVNPQAKVYVSWTDSWVDDEAAECATKKLIEKHEIDILTMHVDSLQPLKIAEEIGVLSIGYNIDNSAYYPETYLTSVVWDWKNFYAPVILKCLQGKFDGRHYWEGVETGIVSLAPLTENVKSGSEEAVRIKMEQLRSGTFDVFYGPIYDNQGNIRVLEGESMTDSAMLNEFDWYVEGVVEDNES